MLRTTLRTILGTSGLVLLLALGACGSGDDGKAADAISESLTAENDELFKVTDEQADCVGEGFVDDIGTDKLTEYGILTEDLEASDEALNTKMEQADAEAAAAVLVDCTDAQKLFSTRCSRAEDMPAEAQACIEEALTDDVVTDFFSATFAQDTSSPARRWLPSRSAWPADRRRVACARSPRGDGGSPRPER